MNTKPAGRIARRARAVLPLLATLLLLMPTPAGAQSTPAQLTRQAYLPLIARPATTTIEFATDVDEATLEPIAPNTAFPGGTDLIYVAVRLEGYAGRSYRIDFIVPSGQRLTGSSRTVLSNDIRTAPSYCFTASSCDVERSPLPGGAYSAEVFVDGALVARNQFTVQ